MLSADIIGALSGLVAARLPDFSVELLERAGLPRFGSDPDLSAQLKNVIDNNSEILKDRQLGFVIVDLTDDPARGFGLSRPAYAGVNDTQYGTVASLAKLLPLYGAYQLRYDLRNYIKECAGNPVSRISDITMLASRVREGYRIINAAESNQSIPLIENIFFPASIESTLDFWRGTEDDTALGAIHAADVNTIHPGPRRARTWGKLRNTDNLVIELDPLFGTPPAPQALYFFEQLRLMAGWSDDISAAIVIEALGFPYLWKLADRSFLFRNIWGPIGTGNPDGVNRDGDQGGLFLAADYWHTSWAARRSGWSDPPEETEAPSHPVNGGTARSVALLMTALAQNHLIGNGATDFDPDAHNEIREILRKKFIDVDDDGNPVNPGEHERGEESPIGAKFRKQAEAPSLGWTISQTPWTPGGTPPTELAVSKIGELPPDEKTGFAGHASNAILVRAGRGGAVPITAVLVGINRRDDHYIPLFTFGREMVQVLAARHSA
jgi:hypothetical protein